MEKTQEKAKYVGEIAAILCLEMIMVLFRMVQPIAWPVKMPLVWQNFMNEFIFSGIEWGLIIVIVAHFIFNVSFEELGLKGFKQSIGAIIGNLCFIGLGIGVVFFTSQFDKLSTFNGLEIGLKITANLLALAVIREVVFRGFLFQSVFKLSRGNGILAGIVSGIASTMVCIPSILMNLKEVHMNELLGALAVPLALGIYLGLIYYYGRNLWICIMIQGVSLSLATLGSDIFIYFLAGAYGTGLLIYLGYKMFMYYKSVSSISEESIEDAKDEVKIEEDSLHTEEILKEEATIEEVSVEEIQEENKHYEETSYKEIICQEDKINVSEESEIQVEEDDLEESHTPYSVETLEEAEVKNQEEMTEKVIELEERKQKMVQALEQEDLEITVIMPCITDTMLKKEKIRFEPKGAEHEIQPEPNFIAHLEQYLGEFEGIYKQAIPTEVPIDVLYFKGEKYDALVTNGMRAIVMSVPPALEDYKQVELMMFIDPAINLSEEDRQEEIHAWLFRLITDLALYPKQMNTYLGWGHIVGNGEDLEPYEANVSYCGALVYPPMAQKDLGFYRYIEKDRNIFIYNVMPLFKEELRFIQEHSSDQFINLMSEMGVSQVIQPNRPNVIKNMKRL